MLRILSEATSLRAGIWFRLSSFLTLYQLDLCSLGRTEQRSERITTVPEILLHRIWNFSNYVELFKGEGILSDLVTHGCVLLPCYVANVCLRSMRSIVSQSGLRENISALVDVLQARGELPGQYLAFVSSLCFCSIIDYNM
ncbi:hypothetical protein EV421DRAFT_1842896 [Armillaria borealis]|uniref:Uncharacterized protein n=1 Tax=Armillaria borealis TaxID=47425 RepID=A0AA39J046_9AGAR|nr:hypothetical protein EV421DRAFT_1842896 [Armillaria borealis]